jgi:hypothetical protein
MIIAYTNAGRKEMKCETCGKTLVRKAGTQGLKWANAVVKFSNKHSNCKAAPRESS